MVFLKPLFTNLLQLFIECQDEFLFEFLHSKTRHSVPWLFLSLIISLRSWHASSTKLLDIHGLYVNPPFAKV